MNNSEDREVVAPQTEKDVPPGFERCNQCRTHNVSPSETSDIENQVKAMTGAHNLLMKNKGFVLLCGCLVILVLIYVLDVFLVNNGMKNSSMLDSIMDLGKTITTLRCIYYNRLTKSLIKNLRLQK